jgi:hypothetical protein
VNVVGSGVCLVAGFGISGVEPSGPVIRNITYRIVCRDFHGLCFRLFVRT